MCAIEVVVCCVEVVMIAQFQKQNFFYDDIQQKESFMMRKENQKKNIYVYSTQKRWVGMLGMNIYNVYIEEDRR